MEQRTRSERPIQVSIYSRGAEKQLFWVGRTRAELRAFAARARREAGYELHQVQLGLEPSDWKAMPSVGPGVVEIRVHAGGEYRVLYVAKFAEGIYVLHVFEKRTQQTRKRDIELARRNLADALRQRAE
jgi:phage-related protein